MASCRLDVGAGDVAIEQPRVIDDGLAVNSSPVAGWQPAGSAHDHRAGLVAHQGDPPGRAAPGTPGRAPSRRQTVDPGRTGAAAWHVGHFDVEPFGAQQPAQHGRQLGVDADHDQPPVGPDCGVDGAGVGRTFGLMGRQAA